MSRLDRIKIATPCLITWEQMVGDERVRFCNHCQLNVYNLSSLSQAKAEELLASTEGRLCARLYRRSDGTVITKDCPVGLKALRRRVSQTAAAVFALIGSLSTVAFGQGGSKKESCRPLAKITQRDIVSSSTETIITGQVTDPSGAVVPGATVTLRNVLTKETETATTNEEGRFQFSSVIAGKYSIEVALLGFGTFKHEDLLVKTNQATNFDLSLVLAAAEALTGVVAISEDELPPPGTTTINQKLLRSLPH